MLHPWIEKQKIKIFELLLKETQIFSNKIKATKSLLPKLKEFMKLSPRSDSYGKKFLISSSEDKDQSFGKIPRDYIALNEKILISNHYDIHDHCKFKTFS